jgi:hypothetical protein
MAVKERLPISTASSNKRLMGFSAINTFIGFAKRAKVAFNRFDKPECGSFLFFTGMFADRTCNTEFSQFAILVCNFTFSGFPFYFCFRFFFRIINIVIFFHGGEFTKKDFVRQGKSIRKTWCVSNYYKGLKFFMFQGLKNRDKGKSTYFRLSFIVSCLNFIEFFLCLCISLFNRLEIPLRSFDIVLRNKYAVLI